MLWVDFRVSVNVMIDKVEPEFKVFEWPDNATAEDFFEFIKTNMTCSINVNSKDPKTQQWIYKHRDWFRKGGE